MAKWSVRIKKKAVKQAKKLPRAIQDRALALTKDLESHGINPGKKWKNFSSLGENIYHCHLTYSYVACWEKVDGEIRVIEVYYVGSREKAPY
jgi:mRNA-degrading endonuclease RelE of RelBE toxin-antitoxin system